MIGEGGATVKVVVTVTGAKEGQVDFMHLGEDGAPKVIHVEQYKGDGALEITAPANYADALYVSAVEYGDDGKIGQGDKVGAYPDAVRLADQDLNIVIELGKTASWFKGVEATPPEGVGTPPAPPPPGGEGGAPATPDGAAPPAPSDGAPPAPPAGTP